MKKLKKLAALVLAAAMVLAMGMTSFAANATTLNGSGKLTITGTTKGKSITLYQLFKAVPGEKENTATYTLNDEFSGFFKSDEKYKCTGKTGAELSEAARAYVAALTEDTDKAAFAKEVLDWVLDTQNKGTVADVSETFTTTATNTEITELAYGYYLVYPQGASVVGTTEPKTPAMLVPVNDANETIKMKSAYPTVDKTVASDDTPSDSDTEIGETVTFTLTSTVPDMTGYESYVFKFVDKLSKGLTFQQIEKVTVGGESGINVTQGTENNTYTLTGPTPDTEDSTKNVITIEMNNFLASYKEKVGQEIKVVYTATINKDAVVSGNGALTGNINEAHVEYSNDPSNSQETTPSTPVEVETYTFKFDLHKYAEDEEEKWLDGAEFELYRDQACTNKVKLVEDGTAGYRVMDTTESGVGVKIVTKDTSDITISGLNAGTYYLKETKAPDGYNMLTEPVKITITPTYGEDKKLESVIIKYKIGNGEEANATNGEVMVVNKDGTLLPETGGMGTVLFTVIGGVLLIAVIGSFVYSRKKSAK